MLLLLLLQAGAAGGHEIRPGYLEINETSPGIFDLDLKVPRRGAMRSQLRIVIPGHCQDLTPMMQSTLLAASMVRYRVDCGKAGLSGMELRIAGLSVYAIDLLARVQRLDGQVQTVILRAGTESFMVPGAASGSRVPGAYLLLGLEHIIFGIDHLLFVLCLLLIVRGIRRIVETITAFTLAHSITLGLAVLGVIRVPQAPVEAVIALSILLLASELARQRVGQAGLTQDYPWAVALAFGLLHGLGFAGALNEIGLPQEDIYLALFSFNVGVEVGQLLFIALALASGGLLRYLLPRHAGPAQLMAVYAIGGIAAFWVVERAASF